jgi:hypothetical protein
MFFPFIEPQKAKSNSSSRSQSPSPIPNKKKDDHKSRKHHRSNDNKRKSHRGKSIQSYLFQIQANLYKIKRQKPCPIFLGLF